MRYAVALYCVSLSLFRISLYASQFWSTFNLKWISEKFLKSTLTLVQEGTIKSILIFYTV